MSDEININVNETNENINIISNEIVEVIDINVGETIEEVTLNITEEVIQVNINKFQSLVTKTSDLINDGEDGINPFITLEDIPPIDVSTLVPYTGATADVNLGEFGLLTGNLEFDNTPTNIPTAAGSMYYNDSDGTLDLILKGGNVKLQIGQEQVVRVVNKTATNITLQESAYQAVRVTGAQGQRLKVDLALATNDLLSAETIGLVTETILNNEEGFVTTSGLVNKINTTGSLQGETWNDGDILYLSPTTAGRITNIKPSAPNHLVIIGYVVYSHSVNGKIFVKVDNGYELDELHNVKINTPLNDQSLVYNSTLQLWENKSVTINIDATPTDGSSNAVSSNGVFDALALKQSASTRRNANNTSNNNINYCGVALGTGVSESSAVWTITRLTIAASGSITTATATNVAWTNRQSATYI
jgi:hypothetical protein